MSTSHAERAFITANLSLRADGRSLTDFRSIALETGAAPVANGSARLSIGGGTEVIAATKLQVDDDGGFVVSVSCSPAAYPHLTQQALDDLQHDLTTLLNTTLTHSSLHPQNLTILPQNRKSWLIHLDLLVLGDSGNIHDALFLAARAALWDTKVPRTRSVEYKAPSAAATKVDDDAMDVSGFDTRSHAWAHAADFELADYWDEGEVLDGRDRWPISITLNIAPDVHFLDATLQEEAAVPHRLLLVFSFAPSGQVDLQAMRTLGPGELTLSQIKDLLEIGQKYAQELYTALNVKLKDEHVRRTQKARDRFARR